MKIRFALFALTTAVLLFASSAAFGAKKFKFDAAETFIYNPLGIGDGGAAEWINGIGEGDRPNCRTNYGLQLQKNVSSETEFAVGTVVEGLSGAVVAEDDTFGYDIRNDSDCLPGSPRFNVIYTLPDGTRGFSFVGGCANGTRTPSPQNAGWTRVAFDLQSQAFPAIPVGSVIESAVLIADDTGSYTLDNIQFRDWYFDQPGGNPGPAPKCSL
ncbi:MAG TPA: hypothetical protein VIL74_18865 [Pyrinomonadaceae bacterium]|jgi:hypothetical protein